MQDVNGGTCVLGVEGQGWDDMYYLLDFSANLKLYHKKAYYFLSFLIDSREGEGRDKERQRNISVREKHDLGASHTSCTRPDWKLNLQPRHMTCLGLKPENFLFAGQCPTNWDMLVRAINYFLKKYINGKAGDTWIKSGF